jgi:hypothetical protein
LSIWESLGFLFHILCFLKSIFEATETGKLEAATEEFAASAPKDFIMFHQKKLDIEACLLHLSSVAKYSGLFKYELHIEQERQYTITLNHQLGEKLSYWLKQTILVGIFNNILGIAPKVFSSKNSIEFSFIVP